MSKVLILELVIGTLIAWTLGLLPAAIARYVIVKRPLRKASANWIAGISSAFFFVVFRLLNGAAEADTPNDEGPSPTGFVWVLRGL